MNPVPDAVGAQLALSRRLRSVAPILLGPGLLTVIRADPASDAAEVFELLVSAIETTPTEDRIWLLLSALSAVYPTRGEISDVRRQFELDPPIVLRMHLLDQALDRVREYGTALAEVELITGGVIVDVDHSAKHELHTGIQRVARKLLPLWDEAHTITPVVWAGHRHRVPSAGAGRGRSGHPLGCKEYRRRCSTDADNWRPTSATVRRPPNRPAFCCRGAASWSWSRFHRAVPTIGWPRWDPAQATSWSESPTTPSRSCRPMPCHPSNR